MEGQAREAVGREGAMSAPPRDVPFRETGTTPSSRTFDVSSSRTFEGSSSRTFEGSYPAQQPHHHPDVQLQDVWAGAIARLQTQVSFNTSMLEKNRRQIADVENVISRLDRDMGVFADEMSQLRDEFRTRPASAQQPRHDVGDLDVLSRQMQALTDKVNEVEGLKMQIDLMKNRMRRFEDQGSPAAMAARIPAPLPREPSLGESQPASQPPARPLSRPLQQPLPPMRTSLMDSPEESRPSLYHQAPQPMAVLQSQHPAPPYQPAVGPRNLSSEPLSGQALVAPGYRAAEPLPPPSAISAWRPAEASQQSTGHPPPPPPPGPVQPRAVQHETLGGGWATVNPHPATKRSFDEPRQSPYESSVGGGSPKRPKLAPIMPRGGYHDDLSYVPSQSTVDSSYDARNRTGSNASQTQSSMLPTPASANANANAPAYRFITSTAQNDSQESWRPETERMLHIQQQHQPGGRARGRGSRGGGRGRRGGRAGQQQELGTPEWEKPGWTGSQVSPNGFYQPLQPFSPRQERGELVRRGGGMAGGPSEHEHITPATPVVHGHHDPFAVGPGGEGQQTSGGKKSRTKPIRNAEGILIRKDGRPDMRSVSSANNLRKVHAKKEAERAEMEGRTPTSARSLAPAGSNSLSEEDEDEPEHETTQERHQALMNRIFPQGAEEASRAAGERFFPRQEAPDSSAVKSEPRSEEEQPQQQTTTDSQMTDVDMRAMSEAQAYEHGQRHSRRDEDVKMPTLEEASQEQETESERKEMVDTQAS